MCGKWEEKRQEQQEKMSTHSLTAEQAPCAAAGLLGKINKVGRIGCSKIDKRRGERIREREWRLLQCVKDSEKEESDPTWPER